MVRNPIPIFGFYLKSSKEHQAYLRSKFWQTLRANPSLLASKMTHLTQVSLLPSQSDALQNNVSKILRALVDQSAPIMMHKQPVLTCTVRIVIPVFGNEDDLELLLKDLGKQSFLSFEIYVVDDGTYSTKLEFIVDNHRDSFENLVLVTRKLRGGFVRACNEGLKDFELDVAIILNSDVRVASNFVYDLASECISESDIGSVSAITNQGSIASILDLYKYESIDFSKLDIEQVNRYLSHASNASISNFKSVDAPVGVGHAMAISGNALRNVGILDEDFSPGYGEEVDWSLRASALGYRHLINPKVFVLHKSGASFGSARDILIRQHSKMISERYPNFDHTVQRFGENDPLKDFRFAFGLFCAGLIATETIVVFTHNQGGGSANINLERTRGDLIFKVQTSGHEGTLMLKILMDDYEHSLEVSSAELFEFLDHFCFSKVQIESTPYLSDYKSNEFMISINSFLDSIYEFTQIEIAIHDYFAICPTINLIDQFGNFCDVPSVEVCNSCLQSNSFNSQGYRAKEIHEWRAPFYNMFTKAHRIKYFSESTRDIFLRAFPDLGEYKLSRVVPSLSRFTPDDSKSRFDPEAYAAYTARTTPHILYLGGINYGKGSGVLTSICKISKKTNDLTFSILGKLDVALPVNCFNHGVYSREKLPMLMNLILPDIVFLPSLTPETYCHAADEVIDLGFRLIAFDHTVIYERYRGHPSFYPISYSTDLNQVYDQIMQIINSLEIMQPNC